MDFLTHGFLPYAAATWLRRPQRERWAAALGGFAPDADVLWAWASDLEPYLYPLTHRGASHTLLGAPLLALLAFGVVGLAARRWKRLGMGPLADVAPGLLLGAVSHLVLDMLTITGVPLLWPFSEARWSLNWFFFSVPYMAIATLVLWIPVLRRRASDRWVRNGGVVLVAILVIAGGLRAATFPYDHGADERVTPGPAEWSWIVTRRNATGVVAQGVAWGERGDPVFFAEPNRTVAAPAIEACLTSSGAVPWRWGQWGEHVAQATPRDDGGWNVTLRDAARLWMDHSDANGFGRRWFGTEEERALRCVVAADGDVTIERRAGFWG